MKYFREFQYAIEAARTHLITEKKKVEADRWQGVAVKGKPDLVMYEAMNFNFSCMVSPRLDTLRQQIHPNLPWADDHFQERVGGVPLNPGEQYKNWPYYNPQRFRENFQQGQEAQFTHTYMERLWTTPRRGIRYEFGNTQDVIDLLVRDPLTRQAFLPIWFPEDTGVIHEGRVPCTIGYHFMYREGKLHMWYPIRSCDFVRHFRDDIYLAARFLLWMLERLAEVAPEKWGSAKPGLLHMHIWSLHLFAGELHLLKQR